ncbi:XRE family transcriptional regulator [Leucobacter sp. OH1287]|nr:XRE family transcriptional regulator [Leucobacter sp. OH1287]
MIRYLSRSEVAELLGVKPDTLNRYKLPEPDAMIGRARGWLPETIEEWDANRPGNGNWRSNQSRPES